MEQLCAGEWAGTAAVAEAQGEGYSAAQSPSGQPRPYHGYLYRILTAQGKDAPGGAEDYVIGGRLIGGFAIVAWPVDYGSSGVMTFIVGPDGSIHQRDLGAQTAQAAAGITKFDTDSSWTRVN